MTKLIDDIFYVGIHGKADVRGFCTESSKASYNSYLIKGDKTALIDTVHSDFSSDFIDNIEKIMLISEIDYLIINYTGTEYLKSIDLLLKKNPDIEVVATTASIKNLKEMLNYSFREHISKNGETLDLGGSILLEFAITPCLPWPDTMMTYINHPNALFTGRLFAAEIDEEAVWDTGINNTAKYENARNKYYEQNLSSYSVFVQNALKLIKQRMPDFIFPSNGPALNGNIDDKINSYLHLTDTIDKNKVSVFCPSHCKNTIAMAQEIADVLRENNINTFVYDADNVTAETINALNNSDALIFGTPTINKNAAHEMWNLLSHFDAVNAKNKPYFVFGSYGWSGEGCELIHRFLAQFKLRPFSKPLSVIFTPSETDIDRISKHTREFVKYLNQNSNIY